MKDYKFYTNIKCSTCEVKVAKVFSTEQGIHSFEVDLEDKDRTLKVQTIDSIKEEDVINLVKSAGYDAKPVKGIFSFFKIKNGTM